MSKFGMHRNLGFAMALLVPLCLLDGFLASKGFAQIRILRAASLAVPQDPFDGLLGETAKFNDTVEADASETPASATEASDPEAAQADATKKMRSDAIGKVKFDRRPSTILNLWAEEGKPKKPADVTTEDGEPETAASKTAADSEVTATEEGSTVNDATEAAETVADSSTNTDASGDDEPKEEAADATQDAAAAEAEVAAKAAAEAAEKLAKQKEAFEAVLKELSDSVTLGRWERVGEMLKDTALFNEEESLALYRQMLKQLSSDIGMDFSQVVGLSDEMQSFMQSMMSNRRNNPAQVYAEKHTISYSDLVEMIRVTPKTLEDQDIETLSRLLQRTLETGSQLEDFVQSLVDGGEQLISKDHAAMLLASAGCNEETPKFLISIEQAKADGKVKILNLWAQHFLAMYAKDVKESFREQAWDVTLAALEIPEAEEDPRDEALARAVSLAPKLKEELGQAWLMDSFTKFPERGKEILAAIGTATAQRLAQMPQDGQERLRNLKLQRAAVDALMKTEPEIDQQWEAILNLLASNWLQEANVSYSYSNASRYGPGMRRDMYGNIYYVDPSQDVEEGVQPLRMGQVTPVEPNEILETAPEGRWFDCIREAIQPQYTMMLCRLWLKVNEDAKAFPYIESLAVTHPETAGELAEEFLQVWTKNHNPNQASQRTNYYMFMYGYETKADKIPLTRSKQQRNLKELSAWVVRLRELPIADSVDEKLLVRAFMTCHSVAEVYDVEDIEKIFGNWDKIDAETMAALIQAMRGNLAGLWRDPNVQRDAGTKRKKSDIQEEVKQGYAIAKRVLDKAMETHPGNWQLLLTKACIMHDENDFIQEITPSSEFSKRREAAFAVFADAANSYVATAADLPEREQTNDAFDYWFYAALGATDLGGVSEKNQVAPAQIDLLAAAMNRIEGEVGERHRDRFANALFSRMSAVSPSCKVRYLDAGFKLVGDNPLAEEARQVHNYYKDLVTELELVTRLDGDTRVGHTEPFGVYVDLRHTKELEREAGGFGKYLQNQNNAYYSYNYGRPTENYRDKFQDAAMTALQEQFEVLSVTFNHAEVKSRAVGDDGWRVTPYAYLLLKARGPEVDKLPALQLDLDFLDTSGYVVLPVGSAPLAIDASESRKQPSASDIKVVQVLDERQSKDGKLIVETKVTAKGLVPDLESLFETKQAGFELASSEDSGVSVIEFDKESAEPIVLSERTFTLTYSPSDPSGEIPKSFAFASPLLDVTDINFQRYVDADLEDVESVVALVEEYGTPWRAWVIGGLCAVAGLVLLIGAAIAIRSRSGQTAAVAEGPKVELTPFSLLSHLKAVYSDESIPAEKRNRLREDITQVERHYFAESNGTAKPDLQSIASRWS